MAARIPTYILAPNWDIPPNGISLGSILNDPKDPMRALNRSSVVDVPANQLTNTHKLNWIRSYKDLINVRVGIFGTFLASILGIGGDIAVNGGRNRDEVYRCDDLETIYFAPDDDYIAASLRSDIIQAYVKKFWHRSIYMVTGLKVAHGASVETKTGKESGLGLKISVDGTASGVPLSGGPETGWSSIKETTTKFGSGDDFVIAYRLLRLRPKKDRVDRSAFNKFALMDSLETPEKISEMWDVEEIEERVDDFENMQSQVVQDNGGQQCRVLIPDIEEGEDDE